MASSVLSSAAVAATPVQINKIPAYTGLKVGSGLPVSKKTINTDITSLASNGSRVNCMLVRSYPHYTQEKLLD